MCGIQALAFVNAVWSDAEPYGPFPNYCFHYHEETLIRLQEVLIYKEVASICPVVVNTP